MLLNFELINCYEKLNTSKGVYKSVLKKTISTCNVCEKVNNIIFSIKRFKTP